MRLSKVYSIQILFAQPLVNLESRSLNFRPIQHDFISPWLACRKRISLGRLMSAPHLSRYYEGSGILGLTTNNISAPFVVTVRSASANAHATSSLFGLYGHQGPGDAS